MAKMFLRDVHFLLRPIFTTGAVVGGQSRSLVIVPAPILKSARGEWLQSLRQAPSENSGCFRGSKTQSMAGLASAGSCCHWSKPANCSQNADWSHWTHNCHRRKPFEPRLVFSISELCVRNSTPELFRDAYSPHPSSQAVLTVHGGRIDGI